MIKFILKYSTVLLIFALGLSISWPLFRSGYFSHQDDLQVIRLVEMRKCFSDFQVPCRWVPDMGWGNGFPLFNFYGVSTYYVGAIISYLTGYLIASKILFFIGLVIGSFGINLLVRELWGKYAGLTAATLYMFAPYKALDIYVRGALAESMALTLIPFVLYFAYKKNFKLFTLTLFFFLITHNIMTIVFLPIVFLWVFYILHTDNFKGLKQFVISFAFSFGLSAFFIMPAFLEKGLVQTESLTRFELDYRANFISLRQLFLDRVWGYGTSIPGPEGGMNFSIGWPHWILAFVSLFFVSSKKINRKTKYLIISIFMTFIMSAFMTHNKSTFIWESISLLAFFQFPWRFLSLSILTASILGGFVISSLKDKMQLYITLFLIVITFLLNWSYFKPRHFYNISEKEKISGELWEQQRKGAVLDYLPKTALEPREGASTTPIIVSGKVNVTEFKNYSNKWSLKVDVENDAKIEIPVYYFPNWAVYVDGKLYPSNHDNLLGRISINLLVGEYDVQGRFKNTLIRTIANLISLISLVIGVIIWRNYKK